MLENDYAIADEPSGKLVTKGMVGACEWRISEAAHGILSKDWTLDNEHQSDVLDRVLSFRLRRQETGKYHGTAGRPNRARRPPSRRHDPV